jgi:membrane protein DedA with SNARE-associated domain
LNSDTLLHYLQNYGPIILAATLFMASLGLPVPASVIVIAAGAFARQGRFSWDQAAVTFAGVRVYSG